MVFRSNGEHEKTVDWMKICGRNIAGESQMWKRKKKYTRKSLLKTSVVETLEMVKEQDYYTFKP
jgi:hypothetical protein